MVNDILKHRQAVQENISKAFASNDTEDSAVEKARLVGDVVIIDGKPQVWTEYAPGKFDWHVVKKNTKILKGKGVDGLHGVQGVKKVFENINKAYTDVGKMALKRTPKGAWRLYYDDADAGVSLEGDVFTSMELKHDNVVYQDRRVVDNFDLVKNYMEFNSPDDVYFVQIIKRWKDNKDKVGADAWKQAEKIKGTYNAGAEYQKYYLIKSAEDLTKLKSEILKACNYDNARAYISINPRSKSQVDAYIDHFKSKYSPNDPRYKNAEAILYGQAKTGPSWRNERFKVLLDIDTPRDSKVKLPNGTTVNVWDETEKRLQNAGVMVKAKYETPSGGLHLILNNKNNRNLPAFYRGLKDFDGGRDLGKLATVHPSEDIKMILYSAVETQGY